MSDGSPSEVAQTIGQRLASPLFGGVATAFLVFNWRFFYVLARAQVDEGAGPDAAITAAQDTLAGGCIPWWWVAPLLIGCAYSALGEWVQYPFHWMRKRADVFRENRLQAIQDSQAILTAHTLYDHPEYQVEVRKVQLLDTLLRRCWPTTGVADPGEPFKVMQSIESVPADRLVLMWPAKPRQDQPLRRIDERGSYNLEKAYCGFGSVSPTHVACVPNGGFVPWPAGEKAKFLRFHNGYAEASYDEEPPDGPHAVKQREGWGKFVARNFPKPKKP